MNLEPKDNAEIVDELRMTRKQLTESVDALMRVTDKLVEYIILLIKATR